MRLHEVPTPDSKGSPAFRRERSAQRIVLSALIIVVNAEPRALRHTEALLSEQGYLVAALSSFVEARKLLDSAMPDLLIADLHLERFNGLQLAIRSHLDHPDVPVIVTSVGEDAVAEAEAKRYGAAFVAAPLENPDFLPSVQAAIAKRRRAQRPIRRWFRKPAAGAVEVNAADARAQIIDMSYGGVRLAFSDSRQIPTTFDIVLPPAGVTVKARSVWTGPSAADDQFYCGAQIAEAAPGYWRQFVDSLQGSPARSPSSSKAHVGEIIPRAPKGAQELAHGARGPAGVTAAAGRWTPPRKWGNQLDLFLDGSTSWGRHTLAPPALTHFSLGSGPKLRRRP